MGDECLETAVQALNDTEAKDIQNDIGQPDGFDYSVSVFYSFYVAIPSQRYEKCVNNDCELEGQHGHHLWKRQFGSEPSLAVDGHGSGGVKV